MSWAAIGRGSRISPGWPPARTAGPVSTAVGRPAAAAKDSAMGSECRSGGSVKANRGSAARSTWVQAS
jgi:hypothetical protein